MHTLSATVTSAWLQGCSFGRHFQLNFLQEEKSGDGFEPFRFEQESRSRATGTSFPSVSVEFSKGSELEECLQA